MKKWTTTLTSSQVSLRRAISLRRGPLNEVEAWAILSSASAFLLQDRSSSTSSSQPIIFCPENTMLRSSGSLKVSTESFAIGDEFRCPFIIPSDNKNLSEAQLLKISLFSLAKTIQSVSSCDILSKPLEAHLSAMISGDKTAAEVHATSSSEIRRLVSGSILDPEAKFISQLSRAGSMGSCSSTSTLNQYRSKPLTSSPKAENSDVIEFSRLDTSTSSEASTPPPALPPKRVHSEVLPEVPAKSQARGAKTPKTFKRNPSRLYRVVEPLTKISTSPVPATKRCVGPEFFVMSEKSPITLDMTVHSRRDSVSKKVTVVMISGQRIVVHVTPSSATAGEVLERALQALDIKESFLFTLATMNNLEEYLPLSSDTKLSKVAPSGWKDSTSVSNDSRSVSSSDSFALYLRFKFFPEDIDTFFKDPNNKHQFYLQCRKDFVQSQFRLSINQALGLAAMALQVEFGDFNEDIHDSGEYFVLDHYLPREIIKEFGRKEAYAALSQLHKATSGQSQSKTEVKFCQEIQKLSHYGFHIFTVYESKKIRDGKRLLGIHNQGIFLFEKSFTANAHAVHASYLWNQIIRIQFDKSHFHLVVKSERESLKYKFYLPMDLQAKVMFDLSAAHHQRHNQMRYSNKASSEADVTAVISYKEPSMSGIRSLKNRILSKRQLSQRKLYTKSSLEDVQTSKPVLETVQPQVKHNSLKRSTTLASTTVKRLTHYSSMAHDLGGESILDTSNKENCTPDKNYRYKVYLEPDDDESSAPNNSQQRLPLQERPLRDYIETPLNRGGLAARRRISTIADHSKRRRSESANPPGRRIAMGRLSQAGSQGGTSTGMRMGTRISMSALHRERIRLTTDLSTLPPAPKKRNLDLDFDSMEVKSIPQRPACNYQNVYFPPKPKSLALLTSTEENRAPQGQEANESLSDSLIERFDKMESDETAQPEREIVAVVLCKDSRGRLGVKITGLPSGIYIGDFDPSGVMVVEGRLKPGDRIIAVNGRSLENVSYNQTLELIKKSPRNVQFLVSQLKSS